MNKNMMEHYIKIRGQAWKTKEMVGLGISVGKPMHEGENLIAAIKMIATLNKPCLIRLSDTLQRHNWIACGMNPLEAWNCCRDEGTAWLMRNKHVLEMLPIRPTVIRWEEVISDPDFEDVLTDFIHLARNDDLFANTLNADVERYLARRTFSSEKERILTAECSRDFLIEELAGHTILGRRYNYAGFYPGSHAKILHLVHEEKIANAPKGMGNAGLVEFSVKQRTQSAA